ncbi:hypothetical protein JCM3775_002692 [Rhodotorula graminis]
MSAEPHKYWPSVGTTYPHWSDLLLATQLAAARAGFNYLGRCWDARVPLQYAVRCNVELKGTTLNCRAWLLTAKAVNEDDPSGAWRVTEVFAYRCHAQRHPEHSGGIGLSSWLKDKPALRTCLKAGDMATGFRDLHTIEGSLKVDALREGRFLTGGLVGGSGSRDFALSCVLETGRCDYYVEFSRLADMQDGEARWRCVEVRGTHTCISTAAAPRERLEWRMNFFPKLPLVDGCTGTSTRVQKTASPPRVTLSDEYIGPFPVHVASAQPPLVPVLPDHGSSVLSDNGTLASAEKDLVDASTAVDKLKSDLAAAEKRADVQRGRVEKKRAKLQRRLERERSKRKSVKEGPRSKDKKRDVKRAGERKKKAEMLALSD